MKKGIELRNELKNSAIWTGVLSLMFLFYCIRAGSVSGALSALPFFIISYYLFFSVGKDEVSSWLRRIIGNEVIRIIFFPAMLIAIYVIYIIINKENPVSGTFALVPYLIIFPVLMFLVRKKEIAKITWIDFTALIIYLLPTALLNVENEGNLPFMGNGFDSLYHIFLILGAVYSYKIIRGLSDVGFSPDFSLKSLWTSLWVWFSFYLFVFIIGYGVDFITISGYEATGKALLISISFTLISTFLHTAVFEELFFRGILQNMLTKRISQAKSWKTFWIWGLIILLPLALLVGYTLKGKMQWFPALMTAAIFTAAWYIENAKKESPGVYTALAVTSVIFGLVHYHSHAIIYIGFACLAGWAYGYTYIKTKNIFCSAIVHALVNCSDLFFGLKFMM
jgi:uncharacterized protein